MKSFTLLFHLVLFSLSIYMASAQQVEVTTLIDSIDASGGMTTDAEGNLYASDFGPAFGVVDSNAKVYKIDRATFAVSLFAEGFIGASGSCFDSQGNFYQANHAGNRISKVFPDGTNELDWSTGDFNTPIGLAADTDDNIYVSDCGSNTIKKITPDGTPSIFADGPLFSCPNGLTIDPENNLYACNYSDGKILKISPDGTVSELVELPVLIGGPTPVGNGHLTFSNGYIFVNLIGRGQVHRVCPSSGDSEAIAGQDLGFSNNDGIGLSATFSKPNGITASLTGDTLFVNGSFHTWPGNSLGLNPSNIRMITGANALSDDLCPPEPIFSQINSGPVATALTISMGGSWADYDNDGDMDLFVPVGGGNNRLYQNIGDGEFALINQNISTDGGSSGNGIWGDYDNDGNVDLYVSNNPAPPTPPEANFLYLNDGPPNYTFSKIANELPATESNHTWSSSWVDYDNDGDLDLHVPENRHLGLDLFYENNGTPINGQYFTPAFPEFVTNVVESTGVVSWMDYDNDCDQDLFMIKSGRSHPSGGENNRIFHNNLSETGTLDFTRIYTADMVNHLSGINPEDRAKDFQASWADYDNDGDMDVYLGNFDGPNFLYRNEGDSIFTQINTGALVTDSTSTLGSSWGDYDNDGDVDLFVSNTTGQASRYYENNGDGTFTNQNAETVGPPVVNISNSQGAANADFNNDGYLDLFVANSALPGQLLPDYLYVNNGGENGYLIIKLNGTESNASAIGARVRIKANIDGEDKWQMRVVTGSPTGDRAQNSMRVHFGIGNADIIDTMIITWPNCQTDIFTNIDINQICELSDDGTTTCSLEPPNFIDEKNKPALEFKVVPNPVSDNEVSIFFENKKLEKVEIMLTDMNGKMLQSHVSRNSEFFKMEMGGLASGIYFLKLKIGDEVGVRKLVRK